MERKILASILKFFLDLLHLFGLLSTVPPLILPRIRELKEIGKTSSESINVSITTELKEWPDFCEDFTNFQNQIKSISERERE